MQVSISVNSHLDQSALTQIQEIIRVATLLDDMAPLSEQVLLQLQHGIDGADQHILAKLDDGQIVGYLHLDQTDEVAGPIVEVVVHPEFRGKKVGSQLVAFAMNRLHDSRLRLWAHGELNSAYALAQSMGFTKSRELWQMRRSLHAELPKLQIPANYTIREFKVDQDEQNWLQLNSKVFAAHPEQGRLDERGLAIRMKETWFDPSGFLLAQNHDGELTGYNWTKIHGNQQTQRQQIGEIYVLGVSPHDRGTGLSTALAIAGLEYLRSKRLAAAMLYVDRDNLAAINLYEKIGFAHWDTDVMFQA